MESGDSILMVTALVVTFGIYALFFRNLKKESEFESKNRILWRLVRVNNNKVKIRDFDDYLSNYIQMKFEAVLPPSKKVLREQRGVRQLIDLNISEYIQEHYSMDENYYYISPQKLDTIMRQEVEDEFRRHNFNI